MENTRSEPVIISKAFTESFVEPCSLEERCGDWIELEQFWGEEKHRLSLQDDGQTKQLSNSLENHLLHDEFLNEPKDDKLKSDLISALSSRTVRRDDFKDIPTSYTVAGFQPHELIVIGTYVDKDILPGFRYKVRKNLTGEYLFNGKAKYLESIGLGYGKRITFEGDTLNENENYFWSDSRINGYGFTLQTLSTEDIYNILDIKTGKEIGRVSINNPAVKEDIVLATEVGDRGYVEKEIRVQFSCDVILHDGLKRQNFFIDDVIVKGRAILVRENMSSKARINQIFLEDFVQDSCLLVPEE